MPLNLCDDILNLIGEHVNIKIETKKYKSKKYNNKMKITKISYKCAKCRGMMTWHRLQYVAAQIQCKNYKDCHQI